ncbi:MAG: hypothetical protein ACREJ5_18885 [Geminicoccaceae bacterium]
MAALAPGLHDLPPAHQDIFGDMHDPIFEQRPQGMSQPRFELDPPLGVSNQLDAEADLSECYRADVQADSRLGGDKGP